MSAHLDLEDLQVDLDGNRATAQLTLDVDELGEELATDGGVWANIDVLAADRYDGREPCAYDCENDADWIVEIKGGSTHATFKCCDSCGSVNRLHPRDVEEYDVRSELLTRAEPDPLVAAALLDGPSPSSSRSTTFGLSTSSRSTLIGHLRTPQIGH